MCSPPLSSCQRRLAPTSLTVAPLSLVHDGPFDQSPPSAAPGAGGGHAEAGVGLGVAQVLVPADGHEVGVRQRFLHGGHRVGHG